MHRTARRDRGRVSSRPTAVRRGVVVAFASLALSGVSTLGSPTPARAAPDAVVVAPVDTSDDERSDDPASPAPSGPPVTIADEFFPESANFSDCVGLVERPGCGAEGRGGWRQALVFVALVAGLALVFWRISIGIRRNRSRPDAEAGVDDPDADDVDAADRSYRHDA